MLAMIELAFHQLAPAGLIRRATISHSPGCGDGRTHVTINQGRHKVGSPTFADVRADKTEPVCHIDSG